MKKGTGTYESFVLLLSFFESGHTLRVVVIEPFRFKRDAITCLVASFATLQIIRRPLGNPYALFTFEIDLYVITCEVLTLETEF